MNQVILDGVSDNMTFFVQPGKYCALNNTDETIMRQYVIKFYQKNTNCMRTENVMDRLLWLVKSFSSIYI